MSELEHPSIAAAMPRARILCIDDNPVILSLLEMALADDFEVELAASGLAGLALAQANPPDLILLDVMLPGIDGLETCRRIKAIPQLAGVPVVFLSGRSDRPTECEGLALGALEYWHKPIGMLFLLQRVGEITAR